MISIVGVDFQTHEIRNVSPQWRAALIQWQHDAPDDKMYCSLHGKCEPISLYVPESIAYKRDRIEEQQSLCGAMEDEDRRRIERDIAAGARCRNKHGG